jgi:hypothetical protein
MRRLHSATHTNCFCQANDENFSQRINVDNDDNYQFCMGEKGLTHASPSSPITSLASPSPLITSLASPSSPITYLVSPSPLIASLALPSPPITSLASPSPIRLSAYEKRVTVRKGKFTKQKANG